jgi:hypothetical protein
MRSRQNVRKFGEVFTPPWMAEEMLNQFPATIWLDREYCFLEAACGNGNFLVAIFERRIQAGLTCEEALNTLVGMDISHLEKILFPGAHRMAHRLASPTFPDEKLASPQADYAQAKMFTPTSCHPSTDNRSRSVSRNLLRRPARVRATAEASGKTLPTTSRTRRPSDHMSDRLPGGGR